jgi:hypothetical protein
LSDKVCGPYKIAHLNWSPIFELYMARLVVKNEYKKKDTCYEEIGPCAQDMDTILGSIDDTSGDAYVIVNRKKESSL